MFGRVKAFLTARENRPTIGVVSFFLIAVFFFLYTLGFISMPNFSGGNEDAKKEEVTPTPSEEPTPTDDEEEEEEDDPTPTVRRAVPTSTPKPTATNTPAPTATHTPAPTATNTPVPNSPTPSISLSPTPSDITPGPTQ